LLFLRSINARWVWDVPENPETGQVKIPLRQAGTIWNLNINWLATAAGNGIVCRASWKTASGFLARE
jgi:hypothetical protein